MKKVSKEELKKFWKENKKEIILGTIAGGIAFAGGYFIGVKFNESDAFTHFLAIGKAE